MSIKKICKIIDFSKAIIRFPKNKGGEEPNKLTVFILIL